MPRVGVVGGGISGAAAAYGLRDRAIDVTMYEATDALGGRMVTRGRGGCTYDYGANFLKADDERIEGLLSEAIGDDLVAVEGGVRVFDGNGTIREGRENQAPKYTTERGVRGIVTALARESGAAIETNTRVGHIDRRADGWRLSTTGGREGEVDALVLALQAGDAASLLADADWGHQLRDDLMVAAERVPHRPVDSVVCHYPFAVERPFYALVSADDEHDVGWLSREECKPGHVPEGESLLIVQLNPLWTSSNPDADAAEIEAVARHGARDLLAEERLLEPDWTDHARWTAAVPDHGIDPGLVERAVRHDLGVAGDWVAGLGRTYAALRTGLGAARRLRDRLEG